VNSLEDLRKSFATKVARMVMSGDSSRLVSLLKSSGLFNAEPEIHESRKPTQTASERDTANRVGIWEKKEGSHHFSRNLEMRKDWHSWANIGRIEPKGARKRVVLIGESVARGYLYDPQFTPALVLESMLQSQFGKSGIDVIDLAQVAVGFSVGELAVSALSLEPDITIMFAGNNWRPTDLFSTEIPGVDSVLRKDGVPGLKQFAESKLSERVSSLLRNVASVYEKKRIPLLWIIPEFNLGDWRDPMCNVPYLSEDGNKEWIATHDRATAALKRGDTALASELATRMIALDGGASVAGFYLQAECSYRLGMPKKARESLEAARDAAIWDPSIGSLSPRSYSVSQNVLRQDASKFIGSEILDLPKLFKEYLGGAIPDRRLFLDYCHMTSEGILVSMAAAASCVIRALGRGDVPWQTLVEKSTSPNRRIEAEAAFLAAVHNAHWYQNYELVHHYCTIATEFAPEMGDLMMKFAEVQAGGSPIFLSAAAEDIAEMPYPSIQHYLFHQHAEQLDKLLTDAISDTLRAKGMDDRTRSIQIRRAERSANVKTTNLLDFYHSSAAAQPQENLWVMPGFTAHKQQDYYKAYWRESRFFFIGDILCPVSLTLTCRLPNLSAGVAEISLNGEIQCEIAVTDEWSTWEINLNENIVLDGINEVKIYWPMPQFNTAQALVEAGNDMLRGWLPELYCSFGDVHTLTAARGALTSQPN
jgi:hypothetical protein